MSWNLPLSCDLPSWESINREFFFPLAEMYKTSLHTAFYCVTPLILPPVNKYLSNFMANSFVLPGTRTVLSHLFNFNTTLSVIFSRLGII